MWGLFFYIVVVLQMNKQTYKLCNMVFIQGKNCMRKYTTYSQRQLIAHISVEVR